MAIKDEKFDSESRLYDREGFSVAAAVQWQREMATKVDVTCFAGEINVIAGADVAFSSDGQYCIAAVVVVKMSDMSVLETTQAVVPLQVPYIPGLLSFREAPAVMAAIRKLSVETDLLMLDGQGVAHPRRFGLACHIGVSVGWPTIGCAKSRLMGTYREPGPGKGCQTRLLDGREVIGRVVRSREGVKPLFVSVGHRVSLDQAVKLVLRCCQRYRLPEPTRLAHQAVTRIRKNF